MAYIYYVDHLYLGHVRSIGVSNYVIRHLEEMSSYASVSPAVNQVPIKLNRIELTYCFKVIYIYMYNCIYTVYIIKVKVMCSKSVCR